MKWKGRRKSSNVIDSRGKKVASTAGAGVILSLVGRRFGMKGILVLIGLAVLLWMTGLVDPAVFLGGPASNQTATYQPSAQEQERFDRRWLQQIGKLDRNLLSGQDRLSYDIFVWNREVSLEGLRFPSELAPINQFASFPTFFARLGSGKSIQPLFATRWTASRMNSKTVSEMK